MRAFSIEDGLNRILTTQGLVGAHPDERRVGQFCHSKGLVLPQRRDQVLELVLGLMMLLGRFVTETFEPAIQGM